MRCAWVSRDADGRPSCEHGPAHSQGPNSWICPDKSYAKVRRYRQNGNGKTVAANWNKSESARSAKALYDLTRVRVS